MIEHLRFGGTRATPRDTAMMYDDPVEQLKKDVNEIANKIAEIINAVNRQERQATNQKTAAD